MCMRICDVCCVHACIYAPGLLVPPCGWSWSGGGLSHPVVVVVLWFFGVLWCSLCACCVHACLHVRLRACEDTHACAHTHLHTIAQISLHMQKCMDAFMHACKRTCKHTCTHACTHNCAHLHKCVCICMHAHTHACTHFGAIRLDASRLEASRPLPSPCGWSWFGEGLSRLWWWFFGSSHACVHTCMQACLDACVQSLSP